jgi:hypothetical protein
MLTSTLDAGVPCSGRPVACYLVTRLSRRSLVRRRIKELPETATEKIQKYILRAQRPAIVPQ